jgi:predicted O-methyltransferase YrrM
MLSRDDFEQVVKQVPHHGTDRHAQLLYGLIRWLNPAIAVEVGACHGFSTCWIARALQDNQKENPGALYPPTLVVIDDYSLQPSAIHALWYNLGQCQVGEMIALAQGNSREVEWPERVDFAYIDGDHSYEGCKHDVEKAISLGARCVAIHDTTSWWGPRRYVEEAFPEGWGEISVAFDQGFTVMMKQPEKPEECFFSEEKFPEGHI